MTTTTEPTISERLNIAREELAQYQERRQRVAQVATTGDYASRAAARIELEDVDGEIARLEGEIPTLEAQVAREQTIVRLSALAAEGATALRAVEDARRAFDRAILPLLERYSDAKGRQIAARQAFYAELGAIDPAEVEATGADLAGVLTNLTEGRDKPHDRPYSGTHRFPGTLRVGMCEEAVRRLGHPLPPDTTITTLPAERKDHRE